MTPGPHCRTVNAGCVSATSSLEKSQVFSCDDAVDNDFAGLIDYPEDPGCSGPADFKEGGRRCGTGFEAAPALILAWALRRRRAATAG